MPAWNENGPTRPGNTSKAESNNIVVGLGVGLPIKLCGGESAVDPKKCSGNEGSAGNSEVDVGTAMITDCGTVDGWTALVSITSMSLWMKLHLYATITHTPVCIFNIQT